ncbi:hypothetical protein KY285_010473 [Solanum tuberosum]|nr:hypothetical protein KY289_011032 [Solanum tuberosum]KAH0734766.1 hypothetical protein KY285_010473 [Solanum tuberosum]
MEATTSRETNRGRHLNSFHPSGKFTTSITDRGSIHGLGDNILNERHHDEITQSTMAPQRKNATKHAPLTTSQSEGHDDSEYSSSEVQINVTPDDLPPRATRSTATRAILQDTLPQSEQGGSSSGNGKDSGSKYDAASGSQTADNSGGSAESVSGSQEDATSYPPMVNTEVETGIREEADATYEGIEITTDYTIVMYVNIHEPDPTARQHLIDCYLSMWIVNRSKEFFNNGIVNKTGSFK